MPIIGCNKTHTVSTTSAAFSAPSPRFPQVPQVVRASRVDQHATRLGCMNTQTSGASFVGTQATIVTAGDIRDIRDIHQIIVNSDIVVDDIVSSYRFILCTLYRKIGDVLSQTSVPPLPKYCRALKTYPPRYHAKIQCATLSSTSLISSSRHQPHKLFHPKRPLLREVPAFRQSQTDKRLQVALRDKSRAATL